MTSKYCDDCGHEKNMHKKRDYECKAEGCNCKGFDRGPIRDEHGNDTSKRWLG